MPGHPSLVAKLAGDKRKIALFAASLITAVILAPAAMASTHKALPGHIVEHAPHVFKAI